ncbi:hypothetical protein EAG_05821 [Camponotus floridanus]|uniref:C2H2-type domain-containing protein n=1 Tax=Camponotus floridanus TaxID=104421 RepID=E2AZN7_CAMFO|nr:hypothetical protein EAG_05821 [Camponotus floridanus]
MSGLFLCCKNKYALAQENLRKHILSTNLHPNKTIYACDFCKGKPFGTNFAKELRAHLLEVHAKIFSTPNDANNYVLGIFSTNSDANTSTPN